MEEINAQDEIQHALIGFIKTTATIPLLWQDVLDVQSEAIFGEYLPER
ncbi:MAG: hypothetical protein H0V18_14465 [Pyrinomonadaceae bacterium]|nr:hypothetical protein [Pyrinomonadaceae bacterium]